jgi:FlaA1/EpsC-like NDP-sugar epimerase
MFAELTRVFVKKLTRRQRSLLSGLLQVLATFLGCFLAILLRFDFTLDARLDPIFAIEFASVLALTRYLCYRALRVDDRSWKYFSAPDVVVLGKAHVLSSLLVGLGLLVYQPTFFPRSILVLELVISLMISGGLRLLVRLFFEKVLLLQNRKVARNEVVVLGAGTSGHLVIKTLLSQAKLGCKVVAVLDDNQYLWGSSVHGVPVLGPLAQLDRTLTAHPSISSVVVAIPSLEKSTITDLRSVAGKFEVALKTIQSFEDIACHEVSEPRTKRTIEQMLERETVVEHEEEIAHALGGKRILVTGAGGSIGSEIVRQVLGFKPASVVLLDQSEYNLFAIQQEIESVDQHREIEKHYVIADVANRCRMERVFREFSPEIVLHAAAYKHVPLMEANCFEAFYTNVIGTRTVLELSGQFGAERFVLISTDKAVDPSSVMGSSKRVAEMMVEAYGGVGSAAASNSWKEKDANVIKLNAGGSLSTAAVRFGNVINSSGSVIPTFRKQILAGRPITVTHPDMTRYFMSIKQAVRLVLTAGTLGRRGEIYLLDMGEPIKIVDVARKLRALYGRRDVPIKFTGLREGEKLYESLVSKIEVVAPSQFKKINVVSAKLAHEVDIFSWVSEFEERVDSLSDAEIGERIRSFVLDLQKSDKSVLEKNSYSKVIGR